MSTYFDFVNNAYSASTYGYDSTAVCYSDKAYEYSTEFYVENSSVPTPSNERAPSEPFPLDEEDIRCVFNTGLIHLLPKFRGFAGECPHKHLEEFYTLCSLMKPPDVPDEDIFLRAFEYSLHGGAKDWCYYLTPGSVTCWEDLKRQFLEKFSPVRYGYNGNPRWTDPSLGWYDAPEQYQPVSNSYMPSSPVQEPQQLQLHEPAHSLSAVDRKLESKLDSLESLVTQLASNQRPAPSPAPVARLCDICSSNDHSTDACPSSEHPVALNAPQAYASNIYNNRQPKQKNQKKQQQQEASGKSSTSEPTLNELWRQMTAQFHEEQTQVSKGSPSQTVLDDASVIHIGDEEQSHELTTAPPTFLPSCAPALEIEETDEDLTDQADMSCNSEIGRPFSPSTILPLCEEEKVHIPTIHSVVDDHVVDRYADYYIVDEPVFNPHSLHDENHFLPSDLNTYSPCIEHESNPVVDIVSTFELDSCSESLSDVQHVTLGLGVISLHDSSLEPHCTNHVAGDTHEFDQHTPTVEHKGASTDKYLKINKHLLNSLINKYCFLDPAVEDISLLDQIWRMKQFFLKTSLLNPIVEDISLQVQNWQLPP